MKIVVIGTPEFALAFDRKYQCIYRHVKLPQDAKSIGAVLDDLRAGKCIAVIQVGHASSAAITAAKLREFKQVNTLHLNEVKLTSFAFILCKDAEEQKKMVAELK